jgi:serine/threonine protein kinase
MTYLAKLTCHPGAVRWAAPELLSGEGPDPAATTQSDMYSFGSIMLQVSRSLLLMQLIKMSYRF